MRDTEFSILACVSGFWSRCTHRLLGALDIPEGGTVSVSIIIHHTPRYLNMRHWQAVQCLLSFSHWHVFTVAIVPSPIQSPSYVGLKITSLA